MSLIKDLFDSVNHIAEPQASRASSTTSDSPAVQIGIIANY